MITSVGRNCDALVVVKGTIWPTHGVKGGKKTGGVGIRVKTRNTPGNRGVNSNPSTAGFHDFAKIERRRANRRTAQNATRLPSVEIRACAPGAQPDGGPSCGSTS